MQAIAVKQIIKNEVLKFLGYDCNKSTRLNSYKRSEWCMPVQTPKNPKGDETEGVKITVIQKFGSQNAQNECPNFVCTVEHTDTKNFSVRRLF